MEDQALEREAKTSADGQAILHYRGDSDSHIVGINRDRDRGFLDRTPEQFSPSTPSALFAGWASSSI